MKERPKPREWQHRDLKLVLPQPVVKRMFDRARQFDVDDGGRFDARSAAVLIWSANDANPDSEPQGAFYVKWHTPVEVATTVYKLEWDEVRGGTEELVWDAMSVLNGSPIEPPKP